MVVQVSGGGFGVQWRQGGLVDAHRVWEGTPDSVSSDCAQPARSVRARSERLKANEKRLSYRTSTRLRIRARPSVSSFVSCSKEGMWRLYGSTDASARGAYSSAYLSTHARSRTAMSPKRGPPRPIRSRPPRLRAPSSAPRQPRTGEAGCRAGVLRGFRAQRRVRPAH